MPYRPLSPCGRPGCPHLRPCAIHGTGYPRWSAPTRASAAARGYGPAWRTRRAEILERDGHLCQPHLRDGHEVRATSVDHIVPRHRGGTDDEDNLEATCARCHGVKTAREGRAAR